MTSTGDNQTPSPDGHPQPEGSLTVIAVPVLGQGGKKRPLSKHTIAMNKIQWECAVALQRRQKGEITTDQFLEIANDCTGRARARKAATKLLCERAQRGEVSLEEFNRECGYSEEDWKKVRPGFEKLTEAREANLARSRDRVTQSRNSRGH
ncbi:hypothetical protein DENSPDRAFT_872999 [Dentipellis sp. KUC8613]|nr:hypothetical protein DENSPDRAFT_872999 [Dentipellis sp. KUC8613]